MIKRFLMATLISLPSICNAADWNKYSFESGWGNITESNRTPGKRLVEALWTYSPPVESYKSQLNRVDSYKELQENLDRFTSEHKVTYADVIMANTTLATFKRQSIYEFPLFRNGDVDAINSLAIFLLTNKSDFQNTHYSSWLSNLTTIFPTNKNDFYNIYGHLWSSNPTTIFPKIAFLNAIPKFLSLYHPHVSGTAPFYSKILKNAYGYSNVFLNGACEIEASLVDLTKEEQRILIQGAMNHGYWHGVMHQFPDSNFLLQLTFERFNIKKLTQAKKGDRIVTPYVLVYSKDIENSIIEQMRREPYFRTLNLDKYVESVEINNVNTALKNNLILCGVSCLALAQAQNINLEKEQIFNLLLAEGVDENILRDVENVWVDLFEEFKDHQSFELIKKYAFM